MTTVAIPADSEADLATAALDDTADPLVDLSDASRAELAEMIATDRKPSLGWWRRNMAPVGVLDLFDLADRQIYERTLADLRAELEAAGVDAGYLDKQCWETAPKAAP